MTETEPVVPVTRPTRIEQSMAGCVVLVTADRRSAELAAALERRGARVRHAPALGIVPLAGDGELLDATRLGRGGRRRGGR